MLLKKIVVQHVKNFLEPREQKLSRKMHKNRFHLLVAGPFILHDNARPHIVDVVIKITLRLWVGSVTSCVLQSRHASTRLQLIPKVKRTHVWTTFFFSGRTFYRRDGTRAIRHMNKSGVLDGIIMLPKRWDSVIEKQGDCIEGLWTDNIKEIKVLVKRILCALLFSNGIRMKCVGFNEV